MDYEPKYPYNEDTDNMDYSHTEAHQRAYDISVYLHEKVRNFPKYEKFTLQQDIRCGIDNVLDEIELYEKTGVASHIYAADNHKSRLVRKIRMAYDLKYINKRAYKYISIELGGLGGCIGGLVKKAKEDKQKSKVRYY